MTSFLFGIILTVLTFVVGDVAYTITLTANESALGGYLVFGFFTFSPVVFFALGFAYPKSNRANRRINIAPSIRTIRTGETYYR